MNTITRVLCLVMLCLNSVLFGLAQVQVLKAGDKVKIDCTEEESINKEYVVTKDGFLILPFLGTVEVIGLTEEKAAQKISTQFVDQRILKKATVQLKRLGSVQEGNRVVIVSELTQASAPLIPSSTPQAQTKPAMSSPAAGPSFKPIRFQGAIAAPGEAAYYLGMRLSDLMKIVQLTSVTDLSQVEVEREGVSKFLLDATKPANLAFELKPGDRVSFAQKVSDFVPSPMIMNTPANSEVSITGAVQRPGKVAFTSGLTLRKALEQTGGLLQKADMRKVRVERAGFQPQFLDFSNPLSDLPLQASDRIFIEMTAETPAMRQWVFVEGAVVYPGQVIFHEGLTLKKAIELSGGMTSKADTKRVRLTRKATGQTETLNGEMILKGFEGDIRLGIGDRIEVPGAKAMVNRSNVPRIAGGAALLFLLFL